MKTIVRGALALLFAAATANAQFEGVADIRISSSGGATTMSGTGKTWISSAGWRSEMVMSNPEMEKTTGVKSMKLVSMGKVADPDTIYMVNDVMKTYSVLDAKKAREMASKMGAPEHKYNVKKLGKDTVAGLPCDKVLITQEDRKSEIEACVSKDFMTGNWLKAMSRGGRGGDFLAALKQAGLEGYPVRMVTKNEGGGGTTTMEVTKVERKRVPPSLFDVPAGYKQTDMMSVMAQSPEQAKQMEEARKRMEDAMKSMTPEQRKALEEMMKGSPPPKQ